MCRPILVPAIVATAALGLGATARPGEQYGGTACADLTALTIPDVTITSAAVRVETLWPAGVQWRSEAPPFCRVAAVAAPSADSHISIEIWIPVDGWNGKLLGTANGGFSGAIPYTAMAGAVARGYAAVGTDTGHSGDQMEFGDGHPEKIVDWGHRAVHVMTTLAKLVIRDHRGRFPDHAYFEGCSTGGQQGLSEAQRYPDDYDGIVAGDPGHNRTRLIYGFLWSWMATHADDGRALLTSAQLSLVTRGAVEACDAQDGLKDGIIGDPRACRFDPSALICRSAGGDACLTADQAAAVAKVYAGAKNPRTGEQIFPGWARGTEQGWTGYITGPREPMRIGLFRYFVFHDPSWDWRTFDWDRDVAFVESQMPALNATSRDLSAFKARGGKLVMYTGLADPVVPPQDTIHYYEDVARSFGGLAAVRSFFRFFPVPGMGHCSGGSGPITFDALGALERWVERGAAPVSLAGASGGRGAAVVRTRPICAYPSVARYGGSGSPDEAKNFACTPPGTVASGRGRARGE